MLSKKIFELLEQNDFSHGAITIQDGAHIIEIGWYSPAGEDFYATIWFDGSSEDFIGKFDEYARDFSVDEHVSLYADSLGQNGVPNSYKELVEDAEAIRKALVGMADKLNGDDVPAEPELFQMMSLSTAHLRPETMAKLERCEIDCLPSFRKPIPREDENSYGAFVCLGDVGYNERNELPADLAQIWDYCYQHDIWWVMFDRDGPMCSRFTDFTPEWEKEAQG